MSHENMIMDLMEALVIADKHTIGDIMAHKGIWKAGVSSVNNSYKALMSLTELGKLVKGRGFFKTSQCKSNYKSHSRLLTKVLAEILKLPYGVIIIRERSIPEIALRPDALVFLRENKQGRCLVIEACSSETEIFLTQKINAWEQWEDSTKYLSNLFGYEIPHYEFLVVGKVHPKSIEMEEICKKF